MNKLEIEHFILEKFKIKSTFIKELVFGRNNSNYLVEINNKKYIFRIPNTEYEFLLNREYEHKNLLKLYENLLTSQILHFDIDGYKIQEYVEGNDLFEDEVTSLLEVSKLLKSLHSIDKFENDYNYLDPLLKLESKVKQNEMYIFLKNEFISRSFVLDKYELVSSHNDFHKRNIINNHDKLIMIDFEYSGNNNYLYDIASYSSDFEENIKLFKLYDGKEEVDTYSLALLRMYQCLKWYLFAKYKSNILVEDRENYLIISQNFISTAHNLYVKYIKGEKC